MNRFKAYLKSIKTGILVYLSPILLILIVLWIFNMTGLMMVYILLFSLFLGLIFLVLGWIDFKQDQSQEELIQDLRQENQALRDDLHQVRFETENYFLTWLHQMKTPITAGQLLLRDLEGDQASDMRLILTEIDKYTGMALSYIKLMNPGTDLEFSSQSLDDILQALIKKYRYSFIYHKITLNYQPLKRSVITDGHWTSILLEQIVSNALKYSPESSQISIYFLDDSQELAIEDQGIGIQSSDIDKIFDKGYVGFNGRLHEKASGLGLYLVDLIANRLSQPVRVQSQVNQGSTFFIKFKLTRL